MIPLAKVILASRNTFTRYLYAGSINSVVHWSCFLILTYIFSIQQMIANIVAFFLAVSCSYIINSRWTFQNQLSLFRFGSYILFMSFLAGLFGYIGQHLNFSALLTLPLFSACSLLFGYLYSRFIVFREQVS